MKLEQINGAYRVPTNTEKTETHITLIRMGFDYLYFYY